MSAVNLTVLDLENESRLKIQTQVGEVGQFEQLAASGRVVDIFPFQCPGEVVGDEDCIESGGKSRIDVGFGAVADHPCGAAFAAMMGGETFVSRMVFFREHFNGAEVRREAGAVELVGLLGRISLRDQDKAVTKGEIGQGFVNLREQLNLMIGDRLREADDALVFVGRDRVIGELFKTGNERFAEAV